ncbi:MAG: SDR family NAD(P)-dependent oxidoreductase [Deltaproteobacteria bacterium]|nr:MAG: SDR family NAD(P)-dependent oxidoreductase [Deltaproteobacteria bacterium]
MSLYARLKKPGPSGFGYASTANEVTTGLDLTGKRILITGCNSGIGHESMRVLADRGATILAAARTEQKAELAIAAVPGEDHVPLPCELSEPHSVMRCVDRVRSLGEPIDVLMLNAGIMALPKLQTAHGFELQFLTNHLGHFLFATSLLDQLAPDARVVVLSSRAHESPVKGGIDFDNLDGSKGYSAIGFYGQSKLANLLFARELGRRFEGTERVALAVHPGVIATNLGRHIGVLANVFFAVANPIALKTIPQGAATQCWAAVHPDAAEHNGGYLADCNPRASSKHGSDLTLAARLWEVSEKIVAPWRESERTDRTSA